MNSPRRSRKALVAICLLGTIKGAAAQSGGRPPQGRDALAEPMSLSDQPNATTQASGDADAERVRKRLDQEGREEYREVSDFFNVREANSQVIQGEWEVEFESLWFTRSHERDEVTLVQTLKYGFTNDFFLELEVLEPNLGYGGDNGAGNMEVIAFDTLIREKDAIPAVAAFIDLRLPTGDGSSGVDAALHGVVTKSLTDKLRVNLQAFIETANGNPSSEDIDRRNFQWGVGPGVDYLFDDKTLGLVNYTNRSSNEYGNHNINLLEFGVVRQIYWKGTVHQHVKLAVDVGLDGQEETPNLGAKFQWSLDWK